eukprot:UN25821
MFSLSIIFCSLVAIFVLPLSVAKRKTQLQRLLFSGKLMLLPPFVDLILLFAYNNVVFDSGANWIVYVQPECGVYLQIFNAIALICLDLYHHLRLKYFSNLDEKAESLNKKNSKPVFT